MSASPPIVGSACSIFRVQQHQSVMLKLDYSCLGDAVRLFYKLSVVQMFVHKVRVALHSFSFSHQLHASVSSCNRLPGYRGYLCHALAHHLPKLIELHHTIARRVCVCGDCSIYENFDRGYVHSERRDEQYLLCSLGGALDSCIQQKVVKASRRSEIVCKCTVF